MRKICIGKVWTYQNSPERGRTWAAEATLCGQGLQFTSYGQKTLKACIAAANKGLKALGWELEGPWEKIYPADRCGPKSDPTWQGSNKKPYKE